MEDWHLCQINSFVKYRQRNNVLVCPAASQMRVIYIFNIYFAPLSIWQACNCSIQIEWSCFNAILKTNYQWEYIHYRNPNLSFPWLGSMVQICRYCVQQGTTDYSLQTGALRQIIYSQEIFKETIEACPQLCYSPFAQKKSAWVWRILPWQDGLYISSFWFDAIQTKHWYRYFSWRIS